MSVHELPETRDSLLLQLRDPANRESWFDVLQQIFPTGKFFADERTNSVIAQGVAPELEKLEALLL